MTQPLIIGAGPDQPRIIDPEATFDSVSGWIADTARQQRAPGFIVGLSGTDSILTFLACYDAMKRLGMPHRVLGLHFEHATRPVQPGQITCATPADHAWVKNDIFPFLRERAPEAILEIDDTIQYGDENRRWGHLMSRAVSAADPRQGLLSTQYFFPVGTRNATEEALGTYSMISKSVSMLPLVDIYKSEVLDICRFLDVPQIAIDKSGEVDCECGRFQVQANYIRELDLFIMHKKGLLSKAFIESAIPADILRDVREFYIEETHFNGFRANTPHRPDGLTVVAK